MPIRKTPAVAAGSTKVGSKSLYIAVNAPSAGAPLVDEDTHSFTNAAEAAERFNEYNGDYPTYVIEYQAVKVHKVMPSKVTFETLTAA